MMQNGIKALACAAVFAVAPIIAWAQGTAAPSADSDGVPWDVGRRLGECVDGAVHSGVRSRVWRTMDDAIQGVLSSCGANVNEWLDNCRKASNGDQYGSCQPRIGQVVGAATGVRLRTEGYGPDYDHQSNGQTPLVQMPPSSEPAR